MLLFGFNGRATRNFLILLVSMHYILFIDRVNLAAAAPVMQQDLGLSNLALGVAFSAFNYVPRCVVSAGLTKLRRFEHFLGSKSVRSLESAPEGRH